MKIVKNEQKKEKFYFSKRPFLEDFLEEVSLFFNVHVYTASEKDYADIILSYIDPKNKIQKRLYRNVDFSFLFFLNYFHDLSRIVRKIKRNILRIWQESMRIYRRLLWSITRKKPLKTF